MFRLVLFGLCACLSAGAAQPWDSPFAKDAQAIAAAAQAARQNDKSGMLMLLDQHRYHFDGKGAFSAVVRRVYLIESKDAVEGWSAVEFGYRPWYEERPAVRARVISPSGVVSVLNPSTIADSPASDFDQSVFSDTRMVRAPLPAVGPGSVVEYEVTIREKQPLLSAGQVYRVELSEYYPTLRFHAVVEADNAVPLKVDTGGFSEGALIKRTERGRTFLEVDVVDTATRKNREAYLTPEVPASPYFAFATGASWQAVSAAYHRILEEKLATPAPAGWAGTLPVGGDPRAIAAAIVSRLHADIRYTGVEFGDAAIVPRTPAEVLERKYGDCKDKSTLLVSALRTAGLKASVALLSAGFQQDVPQELPGLGLFNHAIVYVEADPPIWIDATASSTRLGTLPAMAQGRSALIIRPETTGLVSTPESSPSENWRRDVIDVWLADYGLGRAQERVEAGGNQEVALRESFDSSEANLKEQVQQYAEQRFAGKLQDFDIPDARNIGAPFHVQIRARDIRVAVSGIDNAEVSIHPYLPLVALPYPLLSEPPKDEVPRVADFQFPEVFRYEVVQRVHVPAWLKTGELPPPLELESGGVRFRKVYSLHPDRIEVLTSVEASQRRITAKAFTELRETLQPYVRAPGEFLKFAPVASELLALGKVPEALAAVEEGIKENPSKAGPHIRQARLLLSLGLGFPAREAAGRATAAEPASVVAWQISGMVWSHSSTGARYRGDWNRGEAESCFRKALEIDPDDRSSALFLAELLERNERGFRYASGPQLLEAVELYRKAQKVLETSDVQNRIAVALVYAREFGPAREAMRKISGGSSLSLELLIAGAEHGANRILADPRVTAMAAEDRASMLTHLAFELRAFRRHADVLALFEAAARLNRSPSFQRVVSELGRMRPYEDLLVPPADPRHPVQQLIAMNARGTLSSKSAEPFLSAHLRGLADPAAMLPNLNIADFGESELLSIGVTDDVILDSVLGAELESTGDDVNGYTITSRVGSDITAYVVREKDRYKLLGTPTQLSAVGATVLDLLAKGDVLTARAWLDRVALAARVPGDGAELPAVHSLWSGVGEGARGADSIHRAAASLVGTYSVSPKAVELLRGDRAKSTSAYDRGMIDLALAEAQSKAGDWASLLTVAKRLAQTKQHGHRAMLYSIKAALHLKNWPELEAAGALVFAQNPKNRVAIETVAAARAAQGDLRGAKEWLGKLDGSSEPSLFELEDLTEAWLWMNAGRADKALLAKVAERASDKGRISGKAQRSVTIAMLQVVLGQPAHGVLPLSQSLIERNPQKPGAAYWATYARLCRALGFESSATKALSIARTSEWEDDYAYWALSVAEKAPGGKSVSGN
ncbi:MAG: DUF3857 domain-containing protein [Bryobacterales bacterium]|nr:DUF3857 domain-containing protein [Bryobacterales bacterium]